MNKPNIFILDVDGVMTTGQFLYTKNGKTEKIFGPDDADALSLLMKYIKIIFLSADKRGFNISKKRITEDMGYELYLVNSANRLEWMKKYDLKRIIYMGDGLFDGIIFGEVLYSICPKNAFYLTVNKADYVSQYDGGNRAVADACIHILKKFFEVKKIDEILKA